MYHVGRQVNICELIKTARVKEEWFLSFLFLQFYTLPALHLSTHLVLLLRAGVSSLAAVLVLVQCSYGVQLVLLPALQSHPWLELGGESLQSHVPETLLCAPQD